MRFGTGVCGGEPLVKLLLDDSGGVAGLGWSGGSQVAWLDLGGGAPSAINSADRRAWGRAATQAAGASAAELRRTWSAS
jgi:hypothetical protein